MHFDFEVVHVFPLIHIEAPLVVLVSNSIPDFLAKHALGAFHIIVHKIFQFWLKSVFVNQVEVNVLLCSYLNPDVAFDEVYETLYVKGVVLVPRTGLCHFVVYLLEK
jgi:hypothetical protein